ncbi:hypothetical protein SAMN02745165_01658 [Malonomonas rubra DSM 5091]|uniref:Uncharacterized protein n=1 Tax=Malonomonas rubra DSM 5091 TaxID=1122189 RepID=A0A1M6H254_MALRU|nr:hypothetical protein [Malonomonas rubra]SHJ16277.1 hypothetical protein SAMN02745165_01658 [Malonomonas rubra DSM 5091]
MSKREDVMASLKNHYIYVNQPSSDTNSHKEPINLIFTGPITLHKKDDVDLLFKSVVDGIAYIHRFSPHEYFFVTSIIKEKNLSADQIKSRIIEIVKNKSFSSPGVKYYGDPNIKREPSRLPLSGTEEVYALNYFGSSIFNIEIVNDDFAIVIELNSPDIDQVYEDYGLRSKIEQPCL